MKFEKQGDGRYRLDVTGYVCPHPQLYTKKALEKIGRGEVLELVSKESEGGKYTWKIRKVAG